MPRKGFCPQPRTLHPYARDAGWKGAWAAGGRWAARRHPRAATLALPAHTDLSTLELPAPLAAPQPPRRSLHPHLLSRRPGGTLRGAPSTNMKPCAAPSPSRSDE